MPTRVLYESAIEDQTQQCWGIAVALLRDERLVALRKQDLIYSLTVCGRDGKDEAYEIGSLIDLIWAWKNLFLRK
ncbi:MAG: hypothetical protein ACLSB7_11065 [Parabacteroides distasonis]